MPVLQTQPEPTAEAHAVLPAVQMVQLLAGFQLSQALYAAARLGIADRLRRGRRTQPPSPRTSAPMPSPCAGSCAPWRPSGYSPKPRTGCSGWPRCGETLTQDSPASMRDLAIMRTETHYGPFGGLLETVRAGRCAATTFYGQPFFAWLGGHPSRSNASAAPWPR